MAEVSVEKRFRGSVRLLTLLLWRIGESTDIEIGFSCARNKRMISAENETFLRSCFAADTALDAGKDPGMPITLETVDELQACALRLNSADPA